MSNDGNAIEYMSTFSDTAKKIQKAAKQAAKDSKKSKSAVQKINEKDTKEGSI